MLPLPSLQYIAPELLFSGKYDGTRADTWWVWDDTVKCFRDNALWCHQCNSILQACQPSWP
jgi:hypothetical protein